MKQLDWSLLECLAKHFRTKMVTKSVLRFEKYYTTNWSTFAANLIAQTEVLQGVEK